MAVYMMVETKPENAENYPKGLADAIHFTVISENGLRTPLHSNYGILFAQGQINEKNEIVPVYFQGPMLSKKGNRFYVTATEVVEQEKAERKVCFETRDFISFQECEIVLGENNKIEISEDIANNAILYWNKIYNTEMKVPEAVSVNCKEDLEKVKVTAIYNDGSTHQKKVLWNTENIDFTVPGTYQVKGTVITPKYEFPLEVDTGDPVFLHRAGYWYFIYTHDSNGDIGFYIRRAKSVQELFAAGKYEETILLDKDEQRGFVQTFWAPEFHEIGGRLYVLFAISGQMWGPQCHMMRLKEGGDVFCAETWENPVKVLKADGSPVAQDGITLDMTYIEAESGSYLVWSTRYNCMSEGDTGSMLCIAKTEPKEPWRLTTEPVVLSRPLYGFENVNGTINNEGAYALKKDGKIYLTYSGGSANQYTYTLGLLTADENADLTELSNWEKSPTAVLHFHNTPGRYGAGHNSFFTDEEGNVMIAYHAEVSMDSSQRCTGIHRVHFDISGRPRFDMMPEDDLREDLAEVEMTVSVE